METPGLELPTKKLLPGFWRDVGAASSAKELRCKSHGTGIKTVVHIGANQGKQGNTAGLIPKTQTDNLLHDNCSINSLLQNPKVHHHDDKSVRLDPIQSYLILIFSTGRAYGQLGLWLNCLSVPTMVQLLFSTLF